MSAAFSWYNRRLIDKPILTKAITSFCTFGTGDLISQYLEYYSSGKKKFNFRRFITQASFGFMIAPYFHLQFCKIMPYLFPPGRFSVLKNIVYDQTIGATIFTSSFFTYLDMMSGKSFPEAINELKLKLLPTIYDNWKVWPFLMAINFSMVPIQFRVLFSNICGMFWVAYLSYVQNVKSKRLVQQNKESELPHTNKKL
jgi:protein Mpv17